MVLMRLCKSTCSPESWLFADVTNNKFSCAGFYGPLPPENLSSAFPTKQVSNQSPQLQGLARKL